MGLSEYIYYIKRLSEKSVPNIIIDEEILIPTDVIDAISYIANKKTPYTTLLDYYRKNDANDNVQFKTIEWTNGIKKYVYVNDINMRKYIENTYNKINHLKERIGNNKIITQKFLYGVRRRALLKNVPDKTAEKMTVDKSWMTVLLGARGRLGALDNAANNRHVKRYYLTQ